MTNEEAIESLKKLKSFHNGSYGIAIDLAIKALETQSCDCVRRKDVIILIDEATELHPYKVIGDSETYSNYNQGWEDACNWLYANVESDNLKTATPKARWIPVSERLPEEYIHVLCQFTLNGMGECYLAHGVFHVVGGLVMTCNEVIAWMPLPQPYKEERKDSE